MYCGGHSKRRTADVSLFSATTSEELPRRMRRHTAPRVVRFADEVETEEEELKLTRRELHEIVARLVHDMKKEEVTTTPSIFKGAHGEFANAAMFAIASLSFIFIFHVLVRLRILRKI